MIFKILCKLEAKIIKAQKWVRAQEKRQIEKMLEENKREIDELTQQNIYLKGLLKKY